MKLSEYSLITSMRHWTVFAKAGFGLRLSINVPASLLPKIPVSALVAAHRPQSEKWPGLILELTEDQIVRDLPAIRLRFSSRGKHLSVSRVFLFRETRTTQ